MVEPITPRQFHASADLDDWRVVGAGASAHFQTGSFSVGVALVDEIGRLADAANHHPDIDLRYRTVTVRLVTHEVGGLSERDVGLARQISAAAHHLNVSAAPSAVQVVQISIDASVKSQVLPFWRAVLDYKAMGDEDLVDPDGIGPSLWFQDMDGPRPQRNRVHVDVFVPHDQAEARVAAAVAAGGRVVSDQHAPAWWTLADAEGNEVDVATWVARE
jgi:4a-hydroxytetrahydrobiopterin dehydratase